MLTGARLGEVLGATSAMFDLTNGIWTKPSAHTKQRRLHRVPLNGPALRLLVELKEEAKRFTLFSLALFRIEVGEFLDRAEHGTQPRRGLDELGDGAAHAEDHTNAVISIPLVQKIRQVKNQIQQRVFTQPGSLADNRSPAKTHQCPL